LKFSKLRPTPNENIINANIKGPAILTSSIYLIFIINIHQ
jgi:hypothetical protein